MTCGTVTDDERVRERAREREREISMEQVNGLIHEQIQCYLKADAKKPLEYDLNLNELISHINPTLWESICLLTRSKADI